MQEKQNFISLHAAGLSPKRKNRLVALYREYVSIVRNLEYLVNHYKTHKLAQYVMQNLYDGEEKNNPWTIDMITKAEKAEYERFIEEKNGNPDEDVCYISLDYTSLFHREEKSGILAVPEDFDVSGRRCSLPHRIERYVPTWRRGAIAQKTKFIVNGEYVAYYDRAGNLEDKAIADIFNDETEEGRFSCLLDAIEQLPAKTIENMDLLEPEHLRAAQNETCASYLTYPYENMILNTMALLAEETTDIIRDIQNNHYNDKSLFHAEKSELIPSAHRMQDYLNIRHLLRHQWDTLDNVGKFTDFNTEKSDIIRRSYLASYNKLCDKPLKDRIKEYVNVFDDFVPLVSGLVKGFMIRQKEESNSKFIARLKAFVKENPSTPLLVETGYAENNDKKQSLMKNIAKLFPQAEISDKTDMDMEEFNERVNIHLMREKYLEIYQHIEYRICQLSLLYGKPQPAMKAWEYMLYKKILPAEDIKQWADYRKLRNELSHGYADETVVRQLQDVFDNFLKNASEFEKKIKTVEPEIRVLDKHLCRATHKNGVVVDIDLSNKKVLDITDKSGKSLKKEAPKTVSHKQFTEEYASGMSISCKGMDIVSCRLENGIIIDLNRQYITFPDNTRLFFNGEKNYCLTVGGTKLITDKKFQVINYLHNGKSVSLHKNERVMLPMNHMIKIGGNGALNEHIWTDKEGKTSELSISTSSMENTVNITFDNDVVLQLKGNKASLFRGDMQLTYQNRQEFAEKSPKKNILPQGISPKNKGR